MWLQLPHTNRTRYSTSSELILYVSDKWEIYGKLQSPPRVLMYAWACLCNSKTLHITIYIKEIEIRICFIIPWIICTKFNKTNFIVNLHKNWIGIDWCYAHKSQQLTIISKSIRSVSKNKLKGILVVVVETTGMWIVGLFGYPKLPRNKMKLIRSIVPFCSHLKCPVLAAIPPPTPPQPNHNNSPSFV